MRTTIKRLTVAALTAVALTATAAPADAARGSVVIYGRTWGASTNVRHVVYNPAKNRCVQVPHLFRPKLANQTNAVIWTYARPNCTGVAKAVNVRGALNAYGLRAIKSAG